MPPLSLPARPARPRPALRLYATLGFTEIPTTKPAYERVDVQMTLQL